MLHHINGHEGVRLSVAEYGSPDGLPLLLLHGFCQSHLCWQRQFGLDRFRIIAPDMRGHGFSGQGAYGAEQMGGDIAAIVKALGLHRPLLVGWSMGGLWAGDYLSQYDADIAGLALVGSFCATGQYAPPEAVAASKVERALSVSGVTSDDLGQCIEATRGFLSACFDQKPSDEDFERMLAYNMLCHPTQRYEIMSREVDYRGTLQALASPLMAVHGSKDRIRHVSFARQSADAAHSADLKLYDCGHAPFFECPEQFNNDLLAFADRCF